MERDQGERGWIEDFDFWVSLELYNQESNFQTKLDKGHDRAPPAPRTDYADFGGIRDS